MDEIQMLKESAFRLRHKALATSELSKRNKLMKEYEDLLRDINLMEKFEKHRMWKPAYYADLASRIGRQ